MIQPDAVNVRASDASGPLSITTRERRFYTRVNINLRSFLYYQESTRLTLSYDLVGGEPRSDSWVRVSRAFATFGVWAWGDAGRSTVEVRIPAGYEATVEGDRMSIDRDGPGETLTAEPDKPGRFYAIVSAEDEAAYTSTRISLAGGIELVVRAWPRTSGGANGQRDAPEQGIPSSSSSSASTGPSTTTSRCSSASRPRSRATPGIFYTFEERIEISEDLDPVTIIHEASHAWFNAGLFTERWIFEGLAQEYAWRAQLAVGGPADRVPSSRARTIPAGPSSTCGRSRPSSATRRPTTSSGTAMRRRTGWSARSSRRRGSTTCARPSIRRSAT